MNKVQFQEVLGYLMGMTFEEIIAAFNALPIADDAEITDALMRQALANQKPLTLKDPERMAVAVGQIVESWPV